MAKNGCGFFEDYSFRMSKNNRNYSFRMSKKEDYQVTIAMNDEKTKILNLHNEIASTCTTELPQSAQ